LSKKGVIPEPHISQFRSGIKYRNNGKRMNRGKIVDIEENLPHIVSELICVKCGFRFIGCRIEEVLLKDIECKNCGKGFIIETGEDIEKAKDRVNG
jgi:DNA-directed RNA polymerase subunit RPC12/RpoP